MPYSWERTLRDPRSPFERAFHCVDIYDRVNSSISPRTGIMLAQTCHAAKYARACFNRRAFNVNRHLGRFFQNPLAFRSLQAQTGALISGSSALQFFDRETYEDSDLDVYLHPGHLKQIGAWLMEAEGYTYITENSNTPVTLQPTLHHFDAFRLACNNLDHPISHPTPVFDPEIRRPIEGPASPTIPYFQGDVIQGCTTFVWDAGEQNQRLVQLMVAKYNPLDTILQFHSSK